MNYSEGKDKFIQAWGALGSSWGINRTMAQIHALLLISPEPLTTDDLMGGLDISRGNANMNVRALVDWGLVYKEYKSGDRMDYFRAEKDSWKIAIRVMRERRKRELEPMKQIFEDLQGLEIEGDDRSAEELQKMANELGEFTTKVDGMLDKLSKADESWFVNQLMKRI